MAKIPEAVARLYRNIFVCKRCKKRQRTSMQRIIQKKIICRGCGGKAFRAVRKGK